MNEQFLTMLGFLFKDVSPGSMIEALAIFVIAYWKVQGAAKKGMDSIKQSAVGHFDAIEMRLEKLTQGLEKVGQAVGEVKEALTLVESNHATKLAKLSSKVENLELDVSYLKTK